MLRVLTVFLICAAAQAATQTTSLTVNGTVTSGASSFAVSGPAVFTGQFAASGTLTATIPFTALAGGGTTVPVAYTITLAGGTLVGTFQVPLSVLTGQATAASGSGTITSGTGTYAGYTGTFPGLSGQGGINTTTGAITLTLTGSGTINTSGGGTTGPTAPTIIGLLNNYSSVVPGAPNYGIAPGALFVIYGTGMADASAQAFPLQSSAAPGIPTKLNGASVSVTVNGTTVTPGLYYAIAGQIAAVLPAGTPTGTGTITVSYNGTPSASFPIQVVAAALGIDTYNGLAIATNPTTGALYTQTNTPKPGDIIVLWGSGLGAIGTDSDTVFTSTPHAYNGSFQVYIGGIQANVLYAGDSGYPGVNQIDVAIPSNVSVGCSVSLVAVSGTGNNLVTSNSTALAISNTEGGVCSDPSFGTNGTTFATLSGQSSIKAGTLILVQDTSTAGGTTQTTGIAEAAFNKVTSSTFTTSGSQASLGSCVLSQTLIANAGSTTTTTTALNTGAITVTGPNGTQTLQALNVGLGSSTVGVSFAQLPTGFIPTTGGAFTFKGAAGTDVGAFTATVNFPNPLLSWTNQASDATISRAAGATFNWSGGSAGTYVTITGSSSSTSTGVSASFSCFAPASAGTFTVPNSILLGMPAGTGTATVGNNTNYQSFTATGLDYGFAFGGTSQSITVTYQ